MALQWPPKDPNERLDYSLDWTSWLNGDTISTSSWSIPTGLTLGASSFTTSVTTAWLSGGTINQTYSIVNTITTSGGRVSERTVALTIRQK